MSGKEWSLLIQRLLHGYELELEEFAQRCSVHPSTVTRWIDGQVFPRRKSRLRVLQLFDCASLEDLQNKAQSKERQRNAERAEDVAESTHANSELDQIVQLAYLVMEPGPERRELIEKIPFLRRLSAKAHGFLTEEFKPIAMDLRQNLEIIEDELRYL